MIWPQARLSDISEVVTGSTPSTFNIDYYGGDIPFITPTQLNKEIYVGDSATYVTQAGAKAARLIPENSVMVCCIGSLGKVGISSRPLITNQQINSLVINENIAEPLYVYFYCRTLSNFLENMAPKTTVAIVNKSRFSELTIPLPPLATQKHIARVLEQADQLRKQAQQIESELNQLAQSLFLEIFGDPICNPKNWAVRPLGEIVTNLDGRRVPVKSSDRADKQGSHPYYGASGIIDYVDDFIFDERALLVAEDGANLLMRSTPIAFIAEGKYWVNNHAHVLSENGLARLEYIEYSLNLRDVSPYISGSAQPKLNQAMLNSIKIQCPPIELQDKFTDVLARIRSEKSALLENQKMIEQMFDSLMQRAFNGELTAPERKAA